MKRWMRAPRRLLHALAIEVAADATGIALVIPGVGLFTNYDALQAAAYGIADRNES
jgi:hypothetical protein